MAPSLYTFLGVLPTATQEEIKAAYRRIALDCHPDKFPGDQAKAQRFRDAAAAYDVLGDAEKRGQYDRGELAKLPDAARVLLERLGLGVIDGLAAGAKVQAERLASRLGTRGDRVSSILGQGIDLINEVGRESLRGWLGKR